MAPSLCTTPPPEGASTALSYWWSPLPNSGNIWDSRTAKVTGHGPNNRDSFPGSGVPRGWVRLFNPPCPRNSEGPPKDRAKLNPIVKTVKKFLNLGRQHTKMFGKKGSKILKLRRFAIVLH